MDSRETITLLLQLFPEKEDEYTGHIRVYGELLPDVFYSENVGEKLVKLLEENADTDKIKKYCRFIEAMIFDGDEEVKNTADVSVLESLSVNKTVWHRFAKYISDDLIRYINTVHIHENIAMRGVERLKYNGRK